MNSAGEVEALVAEARPGEELLQSTRLALFALSMAAFLVSLDRAIFAPLLPALAHDLRSSISATGLAVTAYTLPYGFFQLFYGPVADRLGKIAVVRWAVLLFALGTGFCGLVLSLPTLYLLRAFTGACAAAVIPLSLAYIGDAVPYAQRQPVIATLMGMTSLGNALSTAIGGVIGEVLSWRALFFLYGAGSLAAVFLLFRIHAHTASVTDRSASVSMASLAQYRRILLVGQARTLYLLVGLEGVLVTGAFTYIGAYLKTTFQFSYLFIGLILSCYGGGTVLTTNLIRRLRGRWSERTLILLGGSLLGGGFLALAPLPSGTLAVLPLLVMGAGFAAFHSTLQMRATELVPGLRGTAVALFAFFLFLGGGVGTALFSAVVGGPGYLPLLVSAGGGMLFVTVLAWIVW